MLKETETRKWGIGWLDPVSKVNAGHANPFETTRKMAAEATIVTFHIVKVAEEPVSSEPVSGSIPC
jgi:hypothetical protein